MDSSTLYELPERSRIFAQALELKLPPCDFWILRRLMFCTLIRQSLPRLWGIYLNLVHHRFEDETTAAKAILKEGAENWLKEETPKSEDIKWIEETKSRWTPMIGGDWVPANKTWIECVAEMGELTEIRDHVKQERQKAYITYAFLTFSADLPDMSKVRWGEAIWREFGLDQYQDPALLQQAYYHALHEGFKAAGVAGTSIQFEVFWKHYRNNTLFEWMKRSQPMNAAVFEHCGARFVSRLPASSSAMAKPASGNQVMSVSQLLNQ
ncbi:hypothetical protein TSTA_006800 [Talaromyces stipitatus ATCC 10500]|uniref:Uncharacterized protein n=1 Tax=Talaromyces stipitatus (strain ATCC 10500 / CBS 375.48 / QM 6759 / NRRL 1006) TaxID=441959 RepID=B8MU28_TALSN|nr:uncharacterized protein TSTA_006800 [Talaromyces stipitatus ATCC 10500]EED12661.1 hypothetical protein TSTA_006800 [Talaromyces stipitatus ATCC 10500]